MTLSVYYLNCSGNQSESHDGSSDHLILASPSFVQAVQVCVGITCVLSALGAALIIFSFAAFKELRTAARQVLLNLSVADIIVAGSHLTGLFLNYERYVRADQQALEASSRDPRCVSQAAFTVFGTIASFLWTMAIAVYMFCVIVLKKSKLARRLVVAFYLVCWGLPAVIVLYLALEWKFGFHPSATIGWCYVAPNSTIAQVVAEVIGYDLWSYLLIAVLLLLCVPLFFYLRCAAQRPEQERWLLSLPGRTLYLDLKFILIPVIFVLLRVWSFIAVFATFYTSDEQKLSFECSRFNLATVMLAGIGNSAQGLANFILFCCFTKLVREKLFGFFCGCSACKSLVLWNQQRQARARGMLTDTDSQSHMHSRLPILSSTNRSRYSAMRPQNNNLCSTTEVSHTSSVLSSYHTLIATSTTATTTNFTLNTLS